MHGCTSAKWLGRYLYGTKTEGIIYRPKAEDLATLAVTWTLISQGPGTLTTHTQDPVTAKLLTGF